MLRKKALNKNPDEFYHHMVNSKIQRDEHFEKEKDEDLTPEQIKLMETQDIKYITMKRTVERRKIQRLQSQLHLISRDKKTKNKHIFFVDGDDDATKFKVSDHPNQPESLLDESTLQTLNEERDKSYKELEKTKGS